MKATSTLALCLSALWIGVACSSESEPESVGKKQLALLNCSTSQFGSACDPDGAVALLGECDGLCTFDKTSPSGKVVCTPISDLGLANLEHYLCGSGTTCTQ